MWDAVSRYVYTGLQGALSGRLFYLFRKFHLLEHPENIWIRIILSLAYGMYILYIKETICHCRAVCYIKRISDHSIRICSQ